MQTLQFKGPAAYVSNLDRARRFYEDALGLEVGRIMSNGGRPIAVAYTCGLSIWLASDAYEAIFGSAEPVPVPLGARNWENTFESPEFEAIHERFRKAGVAFVYAIWELRWGQLGFRAFDPDGHIIDVSETHGAMVRRMFSAGSSKEAIAERADLSLSQIDSYLAGED